MWIGDNRAIVAKTRTRGHQERARDAVGEQGLRSIKQVLLHVEESEGAAHDGGAFGIDRVGESDAGRDVVLAVGDVTGQGQDGIANRRLGQHLEIVTESVIKSQPRNNSKLILGKQRIRG